MNTLLPHLYCVLPALGLWAFLFASPLIPSVVGLVRREPMTTLDVEDLLATNLYWKLHKLYTCGWCQSFWCAVPGAAGYALNYGRWGYFPLYVLSYAVILYYLSCKIKESAR